MASTKLERIGADLEKARSKRDEWDRKVKDLEAKYQEEENSMIHDMVHAANLTPSQLAKIIDRAAKGNVGDYGDILESPENAQEE